MFPTNGVGFGHFTRMLLLQKGCNKILLWRSFFHDNAHTSFVEAIWYSSPPYLRKYFKGVDSNEWNALLEEELTLCFETHKPSMFIFDGAFPYRGMLRAIQGRNAMKKLWMRRGMFRKCKLRFQWIVFQHFDSIIRPRDAIDYSEEIEHGHELEILHLHQFVLLDEDESDYAREKARYRPGIRLDCHVVYVQLGCRTNQ